MLKITAHINPDTLNGVTSGQLDFRTCVGQLRIENELTGAVEFQNGYVHFEYEGGEPRVSDAGKVTINWRAQKSQTASRGRRNRALTERL